MLRKNPRAGFSYVLILSFFEPVRGVASYFWNQDKIHLFFRE